MNLRLHCRSYVHNMVAMSDDGHDWHYRPPPRGLEPSSYAICANWRKAGYCRIGTDCDLAHGEEEATEWKERFHYRKMKLERARANRVLGQVYKDETVIKRLARSPNPNLLVRSTLEDVDERCSGPLSMTVSPANSKCEWAFQLTSKKLLRAIFLLHDTHRNNFSITTIAMEKRSIEMENDQEWASSLLIARSALPIEYTIKVAFAAETSGTFRQSVVFAYSSELLLVKRLCVDVVPDPDLEELVGIRKEIAESLSERWNAHNSDVVEFVSIAEEKGEWRKHLRSMYPCPTDESFLVSYATVKGSEFTKNNYRDRMHQLLSMEELARYKLIARYNLTARMSLTYFLHRGAGHMQYANIGELYASIRLEQDILDNTSEGSLILDHCDTVYLRPTHSNSQGRRKVYEAIIVEKRKNVIILKISLETSYDLRVSNGSTIEVEIQFQLNRTPFCEWHYSLDKMTSFRTIFPETYLEPEIASERWPTALQGLNIEQREAVNVITMPLWYPLPPVLVLGSFGTGKSFTLARAMMKLLEESGNRILLCTYSNCAADLYVEDYLDRWVEVGERDAKPLRIYDTRTSVETVNPKVQKYCLINNCFKDKVFKIPTMEDVKKHRIIVATLSSSVHLSTMGLSQGYFTHILLDEADQAMECEAITPLAFAYENTRIVLLGDHLQPGPDVVSSFARKRNLHVSLLERICDLYPERFPCKILLRENYRSARSILKFASDEFYEQKLVCISTQSEYTLFHHLTFFAVRGRDVQHNSSGFYNISEVDEVVKRVVQFQRCWPTQWGAYTDRSIGVVTPYADQVFRIRSQLRKQRINNVPVLKVSDVKGKQFRVVILSTVRTRNYGERGDYGHLASSKWLDAVLTRAQSLVAVVGDPAALCSSGGCSGVWERFLHVAEDNKSLFGTTLEELKIQLKRFESKTLYTLNPLASSFVPRQLLQPV